MTDLWMGCQLYSPRIGVSFHRQRTLIVFHHVAEVVAAGVMRLSHTHRVVREVHIAVIAYFSVPKSAGCSELGIPEQWWSISKRLHRIAAFGSDSQVMRVRCRQNGVNMGPTKEYTDSQ